MHARIFSRNTLATGCCLFIAILSSAILSGCKGSGEQASATNNSPSTQTGAQAVVSPSPLSSPTPVATAEATASTPPQPSEVEAVLARVYQTAVVADAQGRASALTGDFNGDASQDIAIIVKPNREQLSELNNELSNWILEDPRHVLTPLTAARTAQGATPHPARAQVEAGDTLLAIIHGFKSEGWRNADAKQTYLLKNAVGTQMHTEARKMVRDAASAQHLPFARGDLIRQVLDNKAGYLYWTGAKYAWHDQTLSRPAAKAKAHNF